MDDSATRGKMIRKDCCLILADLAFLIRTFEKKRKEKQRQDTPFDVNLVRSQVFFWAT